MSLARTLYPLFTMYVCENCSLPALADAGQRAAHCWYSLLFDNKKKKKYEKLNKVTNKKHNET